MKGLYDVAVIGSGVIGAAVARELTRYRLSIAVLEKEPDLCFGTSGRNSGVLHAGFNNVAGSKMAALCVKGNRCFDALAKELGVPFKRTGKLVVGFDDDDKKNLQDLIEHGNSLGDLGLEMVDQAFIQEKAPYARGEFAMWSPTSAILDPFLLTIRLAENAAENGASFFFGREVTDISQQDGVFHIRTSEGIFLARWVINCAGLEADKVASMLGETQYTIYPCRGEYFILDSRAGHKLPLPIYPVPNYKLGGLGVHLTPSVDGNIFIGPSNEYIHEREDYASTQDIQEKLLQDGSRIFPHLTRDLFIRNFAGVRPKLTTKEQGGYHDFVIERAGGGKRAIHLIGIESPGLTASLPIAQEVVSLMQEVENLISNPQFRPVRKAGPAFRVLSVEEQKELIAQNPDYGDIICRCSVITKAEVLEALRGPLGAKTMAGVKYRCRTMMGRCQGGYCQMRVADLIMQETGLSCEKVLYKLNGSYLFTGEVRTNGGK